MQFIFHFRMLRALLTGADWLCGLRMWGLGIVGFRDFFARNITVTNKQTAMGETLQMRDFGEKMTPLKVSEQLSI